MNATKKIKNLLTLATTVFMFNCYAETTTQNYQVSLSVVPNCIAQVENINFGTFSMDYISSSYIHAYGNVTVTCVKNVPFDIQINAGNSNNLGNGRYLLHTNNQDKLVYNLYIDPSRIWGDGFSGTQKLNSVGTGKAVNFPITATLKANQAITPGLYKDELLISVNY